MRRLAFIAALLVCGCTSVPRSLGSTVQLHLEAYDPVSGQYVLSLRNNSAHDVLFLHPLVSYSANVDPMPVGRPAFPLDSPMVLHDRRLGPGGRFTITGTCAADRACQEPGTFAAVHACRFNARWQCDRYLRVWTDKPFNAL